METSDFWENIDYRDVREKTYFIKQLISEIISINEGIWNDNNLENSEKIKSYRYSNELISELMKIQFSLDNYENIDFKDLVNNKLEIFVKRSDVLSKNIPIAISKVIKSQREFEYSYLHELDIDSQRRFLFIDYKFSIEPKPDLMLENGKAINWEKNLNIFSVLTFQPYANIPLPKTYEIVFDIRNLKRFWERKVIVLANDYRRKICWETYRGHSSRLFLEVIGEIPEIFDELTYHPEIKKNKTLIGICTKFDWENIKKKQHLH